MIFGANFGYGRRNLKSVGYTILGAQGNTLQARTTSGVSELKMPGGTGLYYADITLPGGVPSGLVVFDSGQSSIAYVLLSWDENFNILGWQKERTFLMHGFRAYFENLAEWLKDFKGDMEKIKDEAKEIKDGLSKSLTEIKGVKKIKADLEKMLKDISRDTAVASLLTAKTVSAEDLEEVLTEAGIYIPDEVSDNGKKEGELK